MADTAPGSIIGPGNVISANLIGVLISGATATNVTVIGNLIGTDSTGEADLGNAQAGVDIENVTGAVIEGDGQGSQVISGNLMGVLINGAASTKNLVDGNFIGVDRAGTADRGNANEGVLIEGGSDNTVGGTTAACPQRDFRQSVRDQNRRCHRDGQPRRRELHRHRCLGNVAVGERDRRHHLQYQRVEQLDRRHRFAIRAT